MASAGDENQPPRAHVHRFAIPLQAVRGQRIMLRIVPGQGAGQANVPPGHAHFHVMGVPVRPVRVGGGPVNPPQAQVPAQEGISRAAREQQGQAQREAEAEHRKAELRAKLAVSHLPEVIYNSKDGTAQLSWQPVDTPPESVQYEVHMCRDTKEDTTQVYKGHMTTCAVSHDLLHPGHTHHFTVTARTSEASGEPSTRCSLAVPALPPSAPPPPKVANRGKTSLTLRWNAPADNGSPITQYCLEWDECGGEFAPLHNGKEKHFQFKHRFSPGALALFRVKACNSVGWSPYSDVLEFHAGAGPPSTPHPPTLTTAGVHSLTLHWSPPHDNGSPIASYCLEMEDPETGYGFCPVYQGEDTEYTCSGLRRVTGYLFRLSASNEKGAGPHSTICTYHTLPDPPVTPEAPFLKERARPSFLHLKWTPPTDTGGMPITTFLLQVDDGLGGPFSETYHGPDTSHLVEGLSPGRCYCFQLCAVSAGGRSAWSPPGQFRTPATPPGAPSGVRVAGKTTQASISLEWDCPVSDGGAPITSYSLEMRQPQGASWHSAATVADPQTFSDHTPSSPSPLTHTLSHLSPGTTYCFRVNCRNSVGHSGYSAECMATTSPGVPDPPPHLELVSRTATSAHLQWKNSVEHGSVVSGYQMEYCCRGNEWQDPVSTEHTLTHTLRSLLPATHYLARVKALSAAGHSEWTPPLPFNTGASTPSPPTHLNVISRAPTSLLFAWAVPNSNGAPVTNYHIEISGGHMNSHMISLVAMETQHLMEDLQPNVTYRLRVQAENEVGRGPFSSYLSSSTLHPPPSPPPLSLVSCTPNSLKLTWGKRPSKGLEYSLEMAQHGKTYVVYRGSAVSYRAVKLHPSTDYTFRIAASSESGQGEWSDHVTFSTTPTPPHPPTDVVLRQTSNELMAMSWQPVDHPVTYEVQVRTTSPGQDFQQAFKGSAASCTIPIRVYDSPHEARVRGAISCEVNRREEVVWGSYCRTVECVCRREEEEEVEEMTSDGETLVPEKRAWLSGHQLGMLVFLLLSVLTVVFALLLGQYAT